jgi:hypothetical protein
MKKVFHHSFVTIAENRGSVYKKNNNILHLLSQVSFCTIMQEYLRKKDLQFISTKLREFLPEIFHFFSFKSPTVGGFNSILLPDVLILID